MLKMCSVLEEILTTYYIKVIQLVKLNTILVYYRAVYNQLNYIISDKKCQHNIKYLIRGF